MRKKAAYEASRNDPEFQRLTNARAETYDAGQNDLPENDEESKRLDSLLNPDCPGAAR